MFIECVKRGKDFLEAEPQLDSQSDHAFYWGGMISRRDGGVDRGYVVLYGCVIQESTASRRQHGSLQGKLPTTRLNRTPVLLKA